MEGEFKHEVREEKQIIERSEQYSAEIEGYQVLFIEDENHGSRLSIYPLDSRVFPRAGIIECRPEHVEDMEKLADKLPSLLKAVAEHLRSLGKDDLRSRLEREHEELMASLKG